MSSLLHSSTEQHFKPTSPATSYHLIYKMMSKGKIIKMDYRFTFWFVFARLLLQVLELNAKVPALIVFGDSTVDSGNNNEVSTVLKSNFAPYGRDFIGQKPTGRFSNGRIPTDFISEAFGIKPIMPAYLDPAYDITEFATGVCFASAGTGYDNATSDVLEMEYYKEYQEKLRVYLGIEKANEVLREALYMISIGTNDFTENYYFIRRRSSKYSVEEYQNFLIGIGKNFITELYQLGARKVAIAGLPPMGCLPLVRAINIFSGSECVEKFNAVAKDFNVKLQALVKKLNQELVGIRLVLSNPYDFVLDIIQNKDKYGFKDATTACCGTGFFEISYLCNRRNPFTCSDANKYVFWDAFHPTEKTNQIVADYVVKTSLAEFL